MGTETLARPRTGTGTGDSDVRTHYVRCPPGKPSAAAWITEAAVEGKEVEALCGYRWVPGRDPERYLMCLECVKIARDLVGTV